mgnify:CR=1 FL=1
MTFTVFTDGCSNLPGRILQQLQIRVLPCSYVLDGVPGTYEGDIDHFDTHAYYDKLRLGATMKTSLLNSQLFMDHFRPELEKGLDVVYVGMSSGISGTLQAARIAAEELMEEYPQRTVRVVDSLGAGLGTGILTCRAADLRNEGKTANEAADILDVEVMHLLQYFTVDDLNFLKRTGRVSGATAAIGTVGLLVLLQGCKPWDRFRRLTWFAMASALTACFTLFGWLFELRISPGSLLPLLIVLLTTPAVFLAIQRLWSLVTGPRTPAPAI